MSARENFEKWAVKREFDISPNPTAFADELPYADIETQSHFDAFVAGQAAQKEADARIAEHGRIGAHIAAAIRNGD